MQNQVLLGGRELQHGLLVDVLGGLELEPAVGAKDRLTQGRPIYGAAAIDHCRRFIDLGTGVVHIGTAGNIRQQACAGLGHDFFLRIVVGACGGEIRIVVDRFLIDADQTGLGRQWQVRCPGHRTRSTRHGNGQ